MTNKQKRKLRKLEAEYEKALREFERKRERAGKMERCQECKEVVSEGQKPHHPKYCLG